MKTEAVALDKTAMEHTLRLSECLLLAAPFIALLVAYGKVTGKVNLSQWPPAVEMRIGLWFPVILCALIYGLLLMNWHDSRKGIWKRSTGVISVLTVFIFWLIISPVYEASVGRTERYKVGFHY